MDGANHDRPIGLWDDEGNLLAEVVIPPAGSEVEVDANGRKFLYTELESPIVLDAGEIYTIAVWYSEDNSPGLAFGVGFSTIEGFNYLQTAETGAPGGAFAKPTILRDDRLDGYIGPVPRFDLTLPKVNFEDRFRIKSLAMDGTQVTLTWASDPRKTYAVQFSVDLVDFSGDLGDGIEADEGDTTTMTFDLREADLDLEERWFLRVVEES